MWEHIKVSVTTRGQKHCLMTLNQDAWKGDASACKNKMR